MVKALMLNYIFEYVNKVCFHIGSENVRSQIAISRMGAMKTGEQEVTYFGETPKLNFVYEIKKNVVTPPRCASVVSRLFLLLKSFLIHQIWAMNCRCKNDYEGLIF